MALMQYLCDTNIISELSRKVPNSGVLDWADSVKKCALSVITLEEIYYGLMWKPNKRVQKWIETFIAEYTDVLSVTEIISKRAGTLRGQFRAKGINWTQADMFIAATASEHGMTLVTRNVRDFEGCGISLLNPFSSR